MVEITCVCFYSSDSKSKLQKSEGVPADSSQLVSSASVIAGSEAYDTAYSTAAAAYTAAVSAYSYATPSQSQWAAYSAAHPVSVTDALNDRYLINPFFHDHHK